MSVRPVPVEYVGEDDVPSVVAGKIAVLDPCLDGRDRPPVIVPSLTPITRILLPLPFFAGPPSEKGASLTLTGARDGRAVAPPSAASPSL